MFGLRTTSLAIENHDPFTNGRPIALCWNMARRRCISQYEFPYHITARTINADWFELNLDLVWNIFSDLLFLTNKIYDLQIHSFVLMSNHFHLLASTPNQNISQAMHFLMTNTSHRLTEAGNRINQTYGGRHYKTILKTQSYYLNAYKYCYLNPVRAGICNRPEEYPYSTLNGLLGFSKLVIPVCEDETLFPSAQETLAWLNTKSKPHQIEAVRSALQKNYFKYSKHRSSGRFVMDENEII